MQAPNRTNAELANLSLAERSRTDIPDDPYQIWVRILNIRKDHEKLHSPSNYDWYEQGLTTLEGLAVLREVPDLFDKVDWHDIILSGSQIPSRYRYEKTTIYQPAAKDKTDTFLLQKQKNYGRETIVINSELYSEDHPYASLLTRGRIEPPQK